MRTIDADALITRISHALCVDCLDECVACQWRDAINLIKKTPTVGGWISVKDRLPEEHESIFHKFLGTPLWSNAMWKQESDKVLVCVSFPDGKSVVTTGCLQDSGWVTTVSKMIPQTVTHWMPLPEPPKEETT